MSELESHWVPHSFSLVPHRSKELCKLLYIGLFQLLLLRGWVDLGAMAIKGYFVYPEAPDCLVSYQDTHGSSLTPLYRCSRCILQLQPTGLFVVGVFPLAEKQWMYSTAPADWAIRWGCLSSRREAVDVFYGSSRLGHLLWVSFLSQRSSRCILLLQLPVFKIQEPNYKHTIKYNLLFFSLWLNFLYIYLFVY